MAEAPTGTITFLFTDVEGSTRLWQVHPEGMREALATHDGIVRDAIENHDGYVFSTGGDSFAAAFGDPLDAVRAALDAQHALSLAQWGEVEPLKVRMAVDTGLAELRDGDYFGPPLNRAARIEELANGGQILLSNTTADLVRYSLPSGFVLEGLGERKLRDVERPVTIFQLQAESAVPAGSRRGFLIGGMAASGAVLAIALIGAFVLATRSPSVGQPDTTEATTGGTTDGTEPAWSVELTEPVTDVHVEHGALFVATSGGGTTTLHAVDASDGAERWVFEADGGAKSGILTDGRALYLLTETDLSPLSHGDRLWVIDPADGSRVAGCGLVLATADSRVAVTPDEVFALSETGPVYVVPTSVDAPGRCHQHAVENRTYALAPPIASGPLPVGSAVVVGDSQRLYQLDAGDLSLDAFYFPAAGRAEGYLGTPEAVAGAAVRIQTPTAIEETLPVYVVDGEGLLHSSAGGVGAMTSSELMVVFTPLVDSEGVILIEDQTIRKYSHDLATVHWEADVGTVRSAELGGGVVFVADDEAVRVIDATNGDPIWILETGTALTATGGGGRVFLVTDTGAIEVFVFDDSATDDRAIDPIPARAFDDPVEVVERYYTAFNGRDLDALAELYATDAVTDAPRFGLSRSLMFEVTQEEAADHIENVIAFGWQIEIRDCAVVEQTELVTNVACDGTARDAADEVLGIAADGVVRLWVGDGLVRRIEGDRYAENLEWLAPLGFFYVDTPGYMETKEAWLVWADSRFGIGWDAAACEIGQTECAARGEEVAREYVTETGG